MSDRQPTLLKLNAVLLHEATRSIVTPTQHPLG